jgi:hypothetical protein
MLNHFKRKLTKLAARGKARTEASRVRCLVERLEERTMLSASYGAPAYGYGGPDMGPYGGANQQRYSDSAAFASQPRSMTYDSQTFSGVRETDPVYRDVQSHSTMQPALAPPTRQTDYGQMRPPERGWNQFGAAQLYDNAYSYDPGPEYSLHAWYVEPEPYYEVTFVRIENPAPNFQNKAAANFADPDGGASQNSLGLTFKQNGSGGLAGGGIGLHQTNGLTNNNPFQALFDSIGKVNGPNLNTGPTFNSVLANVGSTISDLPAAPQIFSRDATTATVLNAVAREVAFQEFSPSLFQANATSTYDRVNVDAIGQDTMQSEVVDGWIHPTNESTVDVSANSSNAVVRERAAIDAVLEDLQDVDSLLPATAFQDVDSQNDLQTETALNDLPAGEVDGGMVLLQATGDANASGFDLTPVYTEHVGRFNMPAKMETSVGMFQAMDVASDDAPIIETVQQTDSPTQLNRDAQPKDKLPAKREQSSTNKAATVIGVTTLTSALVWMNRSGSRTTRPKPAAQKRRASRG